MTATAKIPAPVLDDVPGRLAAVRKRLAPRLEGAALAWLVERTAPVGAASG